MYVLSLLLLPASLTNKYYSKHTLSALRNMATNCPETSVAQ